MIIDMGERPYICTQCAKCFAQFSNLQAHMMDLSSVVDEKAKEDLQYSFSANSRRLMETSWTCRTASLDSP